MSHQQKWARVFAAGFLRASLFSRREAAFLGRVAAKTFVKKRCYRCGVNPERGGKRQGSALCKECYES